MTYQQFLETLNFLFNTGIITAYEYNDLLQKTIPYLK